MQTTWVYKQLLALKIGPETAELAALAINIALVLLIVVLSTLVIRKMLLKICLRLTRNNRYHWDDALVEHDVFSRLSWFVPVLFAHLSIDSLLPPESSAYLILKRILMVFFVVVGVMSINATLSAVGDITRLLRARQADVLQGFVDAGKIITYILGTIFIISIFSGISPWGIISVLGGLTAVMLLIFKDTILGFVASIQLSSMNMVKIGDWIEMPDYGADGDIISMSIHTIKVQNWDKTITTIPTYALVSQSFKNWRGMSESGGRRIKRALMIDISSISFCSREMLERFSRYRLLADYLTAKEQEIAEHNKKCGLSDDECTSINARRQTNIGVFRAYVIAYLKSNLNLRQDMTFLVRQLPPTEHGLPLEIYVFSKDQRWAFYEAIQADIFDHLFAALPEFGLRAFQVPSGHDLRELKQTGSSESGA